MSLEVWGHRGFPPGFERCPVLPTLLWGVLGVGVCSVSWGVATWPELHQQKTLWISYEPDLIPGRIPGQCLINTWRGKKLSPEVTHGSWMIGLLVWPLFCDGKSEKHLIYKCVDSQGMADVLCFGYCLLFYWARGNDTRWLFLPFLFLFFVEGGETMNTRTAL